MMEYFGWDGGTLPERICLECEDRDFWFKTCWFELTTMQSQGMSEPGVLGGIPAGRRTCGDYQQRDGI